MPFGGTKLRGSFLGTLVKWAAIAIALVLIAFNIGNLLLYNKLEPLLSEQMGKTQAFTAQAIARGLRPSRIRSFVANPDGIYGKSLAEYLDEFREDGAFSSINLLDTMGIVIYSSGGGYESGEYFYYLGIDRAAYNSALAGIADYTELYESGGNYLRGSYAPVLDELGEVAWIIGIEAGAEYYSILATLRRNLLLFFFLTIVVAIAAGGILLSAAMELNRMEKRLLQASALSSIGEMAAGVAHEIRNPLAIIRGSAERLSSAEEENRDKLVGFITEEVARIDEILTGYLSFAKPADGDTGPISLGKVARDVAERVRKRAEKSGVVINVEPGDEVEVVAPESAIRRALLNLYLNAIEAIPEGGNIEVTTRSVGNWVELDIVDNGIGMDKKTTERIFDAFMTNKPNGTGLGLTLSKSIIEDAGGSITVESKPGVGTVFRILLPVSRTSTE